MAKYYATVREARNALALDTGFDPFVVYGGRCTKKKLMEYGYVVDAVKAKQISKEHRCKNCQANVDREYNHEHGRYEHPATCHKCRKYRYMCDDGHVWMMTDDEAKASEHKCPRCGGYSV